MFYLPNETKNTVSIVRIMYGSRDIRRQLSETEMEYWTERHLPEVADALCFFSKEDDRRSLAAFSVDTRLKICSFHCLKLASMI